MANDGGVTAGLLQMMVQHTLGAQQRQAEAAAQDPSFFFEPGKFTPSGQRVEKTLPRGWRTWGGVYPDAKPVGIRVRAMVISIRACSVYLGERV